MKNVLKWLVLIVFFAHASTSLSAQDDDDKRTGNQEKNSY